MTTTMPNGKPGKVRIRRASDDQQRDFESLEDPGVQEFCAGTECFLVRLGDYGDQS